MVINIMRKDNAGEDNAGECRLEAGEAAASNQQGPGRPTETGTSEPRPEGSRSALGMSPFTRVWPRLADWPGRQFERDDGSNCACSPPSLPDWDASLC